MATRGDIRDLFYDELKSVAGTYDVEDANGKVVDTVELTADNIGLRHPETAEELPQVVYHEDYRTVTHNGVGRSEHMRIYDNNGKLVDKVWKEHVEGQFIIDVRASNETVKEPIYEALRRRLGRYQFGAWDEKSVHSDVNDISVENASTADIGDTEDVTRGDQLEARVVFSRRYTKSATLIDEIDTNVDTDGDDTDDYSYTTT